MMIYERTRTPFVCGLDLGQHQDYSALVLLERVDAFGPVDPVTWSRPADGSLCARYLHRFPLGTPYPRIVTQVRDLLLDNRVRGHVHLVVDATGVGAAVMDLLREARTEARLTPVVITSGESVTSGRSYSGVPKKDLVAAVAVFLQNQRLKIPRTMRFADHLIDEMLNFRMRYNPSSGYSTYQAWRERDHDDLVLAMALACWKALELWPQILTGGERAPGYLNAS